MIKVKITKEKFPLIYKISKEVYEGIIDKKIGEDQLHSYGMNPASATMYINCFKHMREGSNFTRTINAPAIEYYLENINLDYGENGLNNALLSLYRHIEYEKRVESSLLNKIYNQYSIKLSRANSIIDEIEQNEIVSTLIKKNKTKKEILDELEKVKTSNNEKITINRKVYKRDNNTIALIKILRDFKCQICDNTILKKDGNFYIEAAHIKAKCLDGNETLDNIILLCPNHHKEFDLGNCIIKQHTKTHVEFCLNDKTYKLMFRPSELSM